MLSIKEQQCEFILQHIADVVFLIETSDNENFIFVYVNPAFLKATGLSEQQVLRKNVTEVIPEPSRSMVLEKYKTALQKQIPMQWQEETKYPSGNKTGLVTIQPICVDENNCSRIIGTVQDITERLEKEKLLALSEEKYRELVEHHADGIALFNEAGQILDVNSSAEEMLQYSRNELRGKEISSVLAPDEIDDTIFRIEQMATGKSSIRMHKMRRKNGGFLETEVNTKKLHAGLYMASVRDISDRLRIQKQLQKEIQLSQSIINNLPGVFFLFTEQGKYLRWNKQLEVVSGYKTEEIVSMSPLDLVKPEERDLVAKEIENTFRFGKGVTEAHILTKGGLEIPYYFNASSIFIDGQKLLLGTGIDLSAIRNLERKLTAQKHEEQKKLIQAMIHAEEKEKQRLGMELHDNVNQILSVVKMYLSLLAKKEPGLNVTFSETMDLLNNAMNEIRYLSHSLAVVYKFEMGLSAVVKEMIEKMNATEKFKVRYEIDDRIDSVSDDRQKLTLYRIIQEQFSNILKHARATLVLLQIKLQHDKIVLTVKDNGIGFDMQNSNRGLGIVNIVNRVESLGGKTDFYTAPAEGCTLQVELPLHSTGH